MADENDVIIVIVLRDFIYDFDKMLGRSAVWITHLQPHVHESHFLVADEVIEGIAIDTFVMLLLTQAEEHKW